MANLKMKNVCSLEKALLIEDDKWREQLRSDQLLPLSAIPSLSLYFSEVVIQVGVGQNSKILDDSHPCVIPSL